MRVRWRFRGGVCRLEGVGWLDERDYRIGNLMGFSTRFGFEIQRFLERSWGLGSLSW
jgi:hypothetical protein